MFTKRITLFTLLGFEVRVDLSWIFLAVLVTWTLADGVFPHYYPNLPAATYWSMGLLGAAGLFFSIIFHELCHSLVARRYGLPMGGITLFLFGGVAEMTDEPPSPRAEFLMAVAGPISSVVLGGAFYAVRYVAATLGAPPAVDGVLFYLGLINLVLAAFNLVPAFPLDGGRMLRAALWHWKGNLRWATRVSSLIGGGFGILLVFLGLLNVVQGNFIGGMWWFLIGLFVRNAASMSYQQVLIRQGFEGVPVRRVMNPKPVAVAPNLTIADLVHDYFYKHYFKTFPVVDGSRLVGYVSARDVKSVPRERWPFTTVANIMSRCTPDNTIRPDVDAIQALQAMNRTGNSRLLVAEGERLLGIVSLKDMMSYLFLKLELEGEERLDLPSLS
ncbi:MAG TPA: site-2 protease family protein [Alphaproteobacteria bacterium]|jgi:Zn-dependent protease/CBS domain-containing protein|nr:site-2 protease family protein [Alphaproteobacteria bacterium]